MTEQARDDPVAEQAPDDPVAEQAPDDPVAEQAPDDPVAEQAPDDPVAGQAPDDPVAAVRAFNRLYTNVIGVLRDGYLGTPYSLTEARLIFELGQQDSTEVASLRRGLDLDAGYLSRILTRFEADRLITRRRSDNDGRRQVIALT